MTFPQADKGEQPSIPVPIPTVSAPNSESSLEGERTREIDVGESTPSGMDDDRSEASVQKTDVCLVCVSGGGGSELEVIRTWCDGVTSVSNLFIYRIETTG